MYATPTAEISLNTPAKCISSVPGDTRHHRFLVGTCALPSSSSSSSQQQQQQQSNETNEGYHDPSLHGLYGSDIGNPRSIPSSSQTQPTTNTPSSSSSNAPNSNHVYLLRYHEEMNELAIDAQFELPCFNPNNHHGDNDDDDNSDCDDEVVVMGRRSKGGGGGGGRRSYGEIWCLSSCPMDTSLLVTNTSTFHHHTTTTNSTTYPPSSNAAAETLLWRMPEGSLRDEDIDYYHTTHHHHDDDDDDMDDDHRMSSSSYQRHRTHSTTSHLNDLPLPLEPVARLVHHPQPTHTTTNNEECPAILRGRISDMHWNPECLPDVIETDGLYSIHPSHSSRSYDDDEEDGPKNDDDDNDDRRKKRSVSPSINRGSGLGLGGGGGGGPNFLTVEYGTSTVTTWDIRTSAALPVDHIRIPSSSSLSSSSSSPYYSSLYTPPKASWDPHNTNRIAVTTGRHVAFLDVRCSETTTTGEGGGGGGDGDGRGFVGGLQNCHRFGVLDVDYNPNVPHTLTTCGQDGLVKFWDVRKGSSHSALLRSTTTTTTTTRYGIGVGRSRGYTPSPTRSVSSSHSNPYTGVGEVGNESILGWMTQNPLRTVRGGHTHWTTAVKYNAFHDQLVLSSGTDGAVNLWRISSVSSAPMAMDCGGGGTGGGGDNRPRRGTRGGRGDDGNSLDDNDVEDDDDLARFLTYRDKDPADNDDDDHGGNADEPSTAGPLSDDDDDEDGGDRPDVRVTRTELSEAVYDVAWSAADPWVFAGLGYDGSVVLNHVPSKEKYKILL